MRWGQGGERGAEVEDGARIPRLENLVAGGRCHCGREKEIRIFKCIELVKNSDINSST